MIAARRDDGRFGPSQWVPNTAPGHWWPLATPTGQLILDPTPWVGGVKPFVLTSPSQFRTPGPNALSSAAWAREFNEVKAHRPVEQRRPDGRSDLHRPLVAEHARLQLELRSRASSRPRRPRPRRHRPPARDAEPRRRRRGDQLLERQVLLGLLAAVERDPPGRRGRQPGDRAGRRLDGRSITAPYPEHPSGHLCLDGAHTRVLRMFFGDAIAGGFQITSISPLPRRRRPEDARLRQLLAGARRGRRGPHLGRTALPHGGRPGRGARPERRRLPVANYFQPVGHGHAG